MASRMRTVGLLLAMLLAVPCVVAWAQEPSPAPAQQSQDPSGAQPQGEEEVPLLPRTPQNDRVPVSGVEDYRLDGLSLGRSFVSGQVKFSQLYGTNTNAAATHSSAQNDSITNFEGLLSLQLLARKSALNLDYRPGFIFFDQRTVGTQFVQQLGVIEKLYLRRWNLVFADEFAYLPQAPVGLAGLANVGGSVSGLPGVGGGLTNFNPGFVPGQNIQTLTNRIIDASVGQAQYTIGPRSSINFSGTFSITHFFDSGFLNSRNVSTQFGYDYAISPKQTLNASYSFSDVFYSPGIPSFAGNAVLVGYRRSITGRMSLTLEGGPQFSHFQNVSGATTSTGTRLSYTIRGVLRYRTARNSFDLNYHHRLSEGSGVLVGAQGDFLSVTLYRMVSRKWTAAVSGQYNHNRGLNQTTGETNSFQFNSWNTYFSASRQIGAYTTLDFHYSVARQTSNSSLCINTTVCGNVSLGQQIGMGLTWNSRPYGIN